MYLVVENAGEIPISALTILGASDKKDGEFIGKFGSGLKFAIAAALRNDLEVGVTIGRKRILFGTTEVQLPRGTISRIRTKAGKLSCWKDRDWTTDLGKHDWHDKEDQGITVAYMIIREFVSNAMDENKGFSIYLSEHVKAVKGCTRIYVSCSPAVQDIVDNLDLYFRQYGRECGIQPTFEGVSGSIYPLRPGHEGGRIYAQGVFVRIPPKPTMYEYDFVDLPITESRTVDPYNLQKSIGKLWAELPKEQLAEIFAKFNSGSWFESEISSWNFGSFDRNTVANAMVILKGEDAVIVHKSIKSSIDPCVPAIAIPDGLYSSLSSYVPCHTPVTKEITCQACGGSGVIKIKVDGTESPF